MPKTYGFIALVSLLLLLILTGNTLTLGNYKTDVKTEKTFGSESFVCVLVDSLIYGDLTFELNRYVTDLANEGLGARVVLCNQTDNASTIRQLFQTQYMQGLTGAFLVGNISAALFESSSSFYVPFPTDMYYMDLDGNWTDSDNNGVLDTITGNKAPEIWVGHLTIPNSKDSIQVLRNYFDKNHAYRTGLLTLPYHALDYIDDDWAQDYDEQLRSNAIEKVFANETKVYDNNITNATDYLDRLQESYYWVHVVAHGDVNCQCFTIPSQQSIDVVWLSNITQTDAKSFFFLLESCNCGKFTEPDYMAAAYVFSKTYTVAVLTDSSVAAFVGPDIFYGALVTGNLGEALKTWYTFMANYRIDALGFFGWTIIGDPTLKVITPYVSPTQTPTIVPTLTPTPIPTQTPIITQTPTILPTLTQTPMPKPPDSPNSTPAPTQTPKLTPTPQPTSSTRPTSTPVPQLTTQPTSPQTLQCVQTPKQPQTLMQAENNSQSIPPEYIVIVLVVIMVAIVTSIIKSTRKKR